MNKLDTIDRIPCLTQRIVLLFLTATLLAAVGLGCNTAKGIGKDVENAGEMIQDGAD